MIIAEKYFPDLFRGGRILLGPPVSYAYGYTYTEKVNITLALFYLPQHSNIAGKVYLHQNQ